MRRTAVMIFVSALVVGLLVPAASARTTPAEVERTNFHGLYFPAGLEGTDTECPYTWLDPAFCVIEMGNWTALPNGRTRIRNMEVYELALSWNEDGVEPRKTGYDIVVANANVDATFSGPTWGTWRLHSFDGTLMFTGRFTGKFKNGIPAVRFFGQGTGEYEGQKMAGTVGRVPDPYNMFGRIITPAGS